MPLHGEDGESVVLCSLDDSVATRYLHGVKPLTEAIYRLMVATVDREVPTVERGEYCSLCRVYAMYGITLGSVTISGINVLDEASSEEYVDQLVTAADAHHRFSCFNKAAE